MKRLIKINEKSYTYIQLRDSAKKKARELYREIYETENPSEDEIIDYFMNLGNLQGGPTLFNNKGEEIGEE